jgi:diphosphomevalonate decarboxylase
LPEIVTARACANIAFIKYWGNRPEGGNLPLNPSISVNLAECLTTTSAQLDPSLKADLLILNGAPAGEKARRRVGQFLDEVRKRSGSAAKARVESRNSFPTGSGIASSASGFAALAAASARAYGLELDTARLSRLARLGSGSAARSVPGGFVELSEGDSDEKAVARQMASEAHWPEWRDVIVICSRDEKEVSSAEGHRLAHTSEMCRARLNAVPERAERVRRAILDCDLTRLGEASEEDALSMHAVMMTSHPPLLYWTARTVEVIEAVWRLRRKGVEAYFTIDAGPNVHVITTRERVEAVRNEMAAFGDVRVERPGPGAEIIEEARA